MRQFFLHMDDSVELIGGKGAGNASGKENGIPEKMRARVGGVGWGGGLVATV